jgi:hypothetical protein
VTTAKSTKERARTYRRRDRLRADPSLAPHGSASTYNNWLCRCAPCRAAHAAKIQADKLRRRGSLADDDPRHGRYTTYGNYGCRCPACREAWHAYWSKQ